MGLVYYAACAWPAPHGYNPASPIIKWTTILIIVAVLVALMLLKRTGQISARDARACMKQGALVIDVRSPGEYNSGHLPSAISIPLDVIETAMPVQVPDKNQMLLHCQSGMRSAVAMRKLKSIGYSNAFNLGSVSRAKSIVGGADGE